jgi:uncharacterized protein
MGWLRRLASDLTGRSDPALIDHLQGQLQATLDGVALARATVGGDIDPSAARARMSDIEHRGDSCRGALVLALSTALAPPMDREDLFRLSRSVDDVLDNLRDLVREMDLYGIAREPLLDDPLEGVETGVRLLCDAVAAILGQPDASRLMALQAKKNEIRPRYQQAVATLLCADDGPVTGMTLRRRELLRRVDVVGLRLGEAADALADGAVKRSH